MLSITFAMGYGAPIQPPFIDVRGQNQKRQQLKEKIISEDQVRVRSQMRLGSITAQSDDFTSQDNDLDDYRKVQ